MERKEEENKKKRKDGTNYPSKAGAEDEGRREVNRKASMKNRRTKRRMARGK
jgi:hypothetical protein